MEVDPGLKGTWFQPVESTSPFKVLVSDVFNLHPYKAEEAEIEESGAAAVRLDMTWKSADEEEAEIVVGVVQAASHPGLKARTWFSSFKF